MLTDSIDRKLVATFFDGRAQSWDDRRRANSRTIERILERADIRAGESVLDVGCGTGVLFPWYLERNARRIVGVDLSAAMIGIARSKWSDPRIELVNADIETAAFSCRFDRVVVLNALPHFPCPAGLVFRLAGLLEPGGRLTVAHDMGRERINALHGMRAGSVSRELLPADALAALFPHTLEVDQMISDEGMYLVSGVSRGRRIFAGKALYDELTLVDESGHRFEE